MEALGAGRDASAVWRALDALRCTAQARQNVILAWVAAARAA
ncbi:MAG: hypothetical protein ACRD0K_03050 [Egibacteraceae bacterium]